MRPLLFLLLFVGCLLPPWAGAQPVVLPADEDEERVALRGHLTYWRDTSNQATVREVCRPAGASAFQPVQSPVPNFGYTSSRQLAHPVWLRFGLRNPTARPQDWLAEVDFWCFDALQLYVLDGQNRVLSVSPVQHWKLPVGQRLRHHRHYWLPLTVPAGADVTVLLRVLKRRGTQIVPVELIRASAYEAIVDRGYLFWGGVLWTLGFVAVMSGFFFLTTLDRVYWKYVLCLLGLIGFFWINGGFLNQYQFDAQFWLPGQNSYFLFPLILFYSQLGFVRSFLSLRHTPAYRWHMVGTVVLMGGLLCFLMLGVERFWALPTNLEIGMMRVFIALYWLPMPVIGGYIVISIWRGHHVREAWLYLVAITPFYVLNFGQVLANLGVVPTYEPLANYTYYALAALFEVLVLTFGLAYRYKIDRDQADQLLVERTRQQRQAYEADVQTLALRNSLLAEKERIARDLHDNVGAHLAFVVTNLTHISGQPESVLTANSRQWIEQLRTVVDHTREAVKLLRETIWAIHQEQFSVEEFAERLNQYVNRYVYSPEGLSVDVLVEGSPEQRLSSGQVLNLFRIVQEALNNVVKHAHATQATVNLRVGPGVHLCLRIEDNGQGFAGVNGTVPDHHYGLRNMKARAEELGGTFQVHVNNGTAVEVKV